MENNETLDQATARLEDNVKSANDMKSLLTDDRFIDLFEEKFIKAFAVTNVYNLANYDEKTRERVQEKMVARSHFTMFISSVINDGNTAVAELAEIAQSLDEDTEEAT